MRSGAGRSWRRLRLTLLVLATALLVGSAVSTGRDLVTTSRSEVRGVLEQAARADARSVASGFAEAGRFTLLAARNPLFGATAPDQAKLVRALGDLTASADGRIVSAALVDPDGRVVAQVVDGVAVDAGTGRRRAGEMRLIAPTFQLSLGVVHHSRPYRSRQADRWVIASSTLVSRADDGRPRALVVMRDLATVHEALTTSDARILSRAVGTDGRVIATSRLAGADGAPIGTDTDSALLREVAAQAGYVVRDGRALAVQTIDLSPTNDNTWSVVASMPAARAGSVFGAGQAAAATIAAAMLLLLLGVASLRGHRRAMAVAVVTDPLTGMLNRTALAERGGEILARDGRDGTMTAVMCLDLLRFHDVNAALGHQAGDAVMLEVSERLRAAIRPGDLVVRLGGDEFAILLATVADRAGAEDAARGILDALAPAIPVRGRHVGLHATIGAALAPGDGATVDDLLEAAGRALYAARGAAADLCFFDATMEPLAHEGLGLGADLRHAAERGELRLRYQPTVNLRTGRVEGVEALVRWEHPRLGLLAPARFLPLAERTGLIAQITRTAITQALAQSRAWLDAGLGLPISVNLSSRCVADPATVDVVAKGLTRWQVPPHLLELEIVGSEMTWDDPTTRSVLTRLASLGVRLVLDDAGAGHSSLVAARRLPVCAVKIDRAIVAGIGHEPVSDEIVGAVVRAGHAIGLRVVAEGVEERDTVRRLAALGCDGAQGNFFCAPLTAQELDLWFAHHGLRPAASTGPAEPR